MIRKKIAVIINGDLSINRQGQINSAINRVKHLKKLDVFDIDVFCVQEYDYGLLRILRHQKKITPKTVQETDNVIVNVIYKKVLLSDWLCENVFKIRPLYSSWCFRKIAWRMKGYDLIVGHSIVGGVVGLKTHSLYGTPYCVIWHGSDIHTNPVSNRHTKELSQNVLLMASGNIFVSLSLLNTAIKVFRNVAAPHVSYNAPAEQFIKYNDEQKKELRKKCGVVGKKVVAFVGNLVPVKNVFTLPGIFKNVGTKCEDVVFWVIGDGMHRQALMNKMEEAGVECKFWGNQQPEAMPDLMNCIDVLVLPSKNESFGMVLVEAISCGANAVGSNRGGIPEVIGNENCFELDGSFEEKISKRIVYMLNNQVLQMVNNDYNWNTTALIEERIYSEILE